jgi:hypothetical protein
MDIAVRGRTAPIAAASPATLTTPQSRLAALRSRLTGRANIPPDEAA